MLMYGVLIYVFGIYKHHRRLLYSWFPRVKSLTYRSFRRPVKYLWKSGISLKHASNKTKLQTDRQTDRQTYEQSQVWDTQPYLLEQFAPVLRAKCHKLRCRNHIKGDVMWYHILVIIHLSVCNFVFFLKLESFMSLWFSSSDPLSGKQTWEDFLPSAFSSLLDLSKTLSPFRFPSGVTSMSSAVSHASSPEYYPESFFRLSRRMIN